MNEFLVSMVQIKVERQRTNTEYNGASQMIGLKINVVLIGIGNDVASNLYIWQSMQVNLLLVVETEPIYRVQHFLI